jgi:PKHD-type hydroxylase
MRKIIIPKNVESVDQSNYYWFENGFSDEEINKIHEYAEKFHYKEGEIFSNSDIHNIRRSKLKWLEPSNESTWLYKKIFDLANIANDSCFKFKLHYAEDDLQYTLYEEKCKGKYDWHIDIGEGINSLRKISVVLLLTDPNEFEGGELQFFISDKSRSVPLKKGSIVFFPSFFLHRVTEVTKGNRQTLVLWLGGDHYQ